jgi:hypothetical protein
MMAILGIEKGIEREFNPFFYAPVHFEIGCLNFNVNHNDQT